MLCTSAGAADSDPAALNRVMTRIGATMVETYPLIVAQREFTPADAKTLSANVKRLNDLFVEAGPYIRTRADTYVVSYRYILDYLQETQRALNEKNVDYARSRLYGLGSICASCHTQDTRLRTLFAGAGRDKFADDASYAEFNFLTRNYDEAEKYFERELRAPGTKTEYDIIRPLQRLVVIYAQIRNQPGAGAEALGKFVDLPQHTATTRQELKGWVTGMRALDATGAGKVTAPAFRELESLVNEILGPLDQPLNVIRVPPDQEVRRIWLSGLLYHYLNRKPPADEVPKLLYWLAVNDRVVGYNYFYSLADLYLRECVYGHAAHPYAARCLAEFQEYVNFAYSGSGGTFIPEELQNELNKMKQAVDQAAAKRKK
jgi:hypothetical protein